MHRGDRVIADLIFSPGFLPDIANISRKGTLRIFIFSGHTEKTIQQLMQICCVDYIIVGKKLYTIFGEKTVISICQLKAFIYNSTVQWAGRSFRLWYEEER